VFFNAGRSIGDKIALADAASRRPFMGTSVALKKTLPAEAAARKQAPAGANSLFGSGPGGKPPKRTLSGRFCCDARPLTCYLIRDPRPWGKPMRRRELITLLGARLRGLSRHVNNSGREITADEKYSPRFLLCMTSTVIQ